MEGVIFFKDEQWIKVEWKTLKYKNWMKVEMK